MKRLQAILAIIVCKATRWLLRIMGRGGTNFPGKLAGKLCPDLLAFLGSQVFTIIITGTNGKTTSSRMLEQCLKNGGIDAFANRSGANMFPGITAEFVANATWTGEMKKPYAIIECDEFAFKHVAKYVDAKVILMTNVFRDQLDRYGEIKNTINSIRVGIENSPHAIVCINADCPLSVNMMEGLSHPVRYFGVETELYEDVREEISEASRCPKCIREYVYDYKTYGHLGAYHCPQCGSKRPDAHVGVTEVVEKTPDTTTIRVRTGEGISMITINLPSAYNIYNAAGIIAVAEVLNLGMHVTGSALEEFSGGFGRMEHIDLGSQTARMILVKNPIGFSQALRYLADVDEPVAFVVCLNDRKADGTDISWIWDVDAGMLGEMGERLTSVYCSGIRADDLAVWVKYSGVDEKKIHVKYSYDSLLEAISHSPVPVIIMPTYTAMLDLRGKLEKQYGLVKFWE